MLKDKKLEVSAGEKEPILGWRVWRFDEKGRLFSVSNKPNNKHCPCCHLHAEVEEMRAWPAGAPLVASGFPDTPISGIHAMKEDWASELDNLTYGSICVGVVALWGLIHEHADGYRAMYGYPVKLYFLRCDEAAAGAAAARYRVPVELLERFPFARPQPESMEDRMAAIAKREWKRKREMATRAEISLLRATEPTLPPVKGQTPKRVEALLFIAANPAGIRRSQLTKQTNLIRQAHLERRLRGTIQQSTPAGETLLQLERLGLVIRTMERGDELNLWTLTGAGRKLVDLIQGSSLRKEEK